VHVDVRVIAATNRDLDRAVTQGQFREDLFFRLNVVSINLPPLRDRREDVMLIAEHILMSRATRVGKTLKGFSSAAQELLLRYSFPGNVRELENIVERALVWSRGEFILPEHLPTILRADSTAETLREETLSGRLSLEQAVRAFEREMILDALKRTNFVQTQASALLGISRRMLKYRMDILGITRDLALGSDRDALPEETAIEN
jgi:DNA-binding NtrC family response regulator